MPFEISETTREKLSRVCQKYYVRKLSILGSTLRGEARDDSDLDILVEFIPGRVPGFAFVDLQEELSAIFHRPVDLRTPNDVSRYFRDLVVRESLSIYTQV